MSACEGVHFAKLESGEATQYGGINTVCGALKTVGTYGITWPSVIKLKSLVRLYSAG